MKRIVYLTLAVLLCTAFRKEKQKVPMVGKEVPSFALPGINGETTGPGNYPLAKGFIVVFTCNHCPFARLYTERLNALARQYGDTVPLIAINPMDSLLYASETLSDMRDFAAQAQYNFPYLRDATQSVARTFSASHTPQAYVLWKEGEKLIVRYQGALDDNGQHPEKATPFVQRVVAALLAQQELPYTEKLSIGCTINYRP